MAKKSKTKTPAEAVESQGQGKKSEPVSVADVNTLTPEAGDDVGEGQLQEVKDREEEHGLRGAKVDPTPNENYSVEGVTSGAPTPETDESVRDENRVARTMDGPRPI